MSSDEKKEKVIHTQVGPNHSTIKGVVKINFGVTKLKRFIRSLKRRPRNG